MASDQVLYCLLTECSDHQNLIKVKYTTQHPSKREEPDEIPHKAAFQQGLHILKKKWTIPYLLNEIIHQNEKRLSHGDEVINPFQPNELSFSRTSQFPILEVLGVIFLIFIQILIEHSVSIQWRP